MNSDTTIKPTHKVVLYRNVMIYFELPAPDDHSINARIVVHAKFVCTYGFLTAPQYNETIDAMQVKQMKQVYHLRHLHGAQIMIDTYYDLSYASTHELRNFQVFPYYSCHTLLYQTYFNSSAGAIIGEVANFEHISWI
jgi:hypothetical protein